jgi:hypothetical protein
VTAAVAKRKPSGAQRRALARAIKRGDLFGALAAPRLLKRFDKAGRPEGTRTTKDRIEGFGGEAEGLRAYLVWLGRPDLSVAEIIELLHTPYPGPIKEGEHYRRQVAAAYKEVSRRTLERYVEAVQGETWGPERKAWGRSVGADMPLGGRKEPKKTVTASAWEKAGVSKATWYRRQHRRRAP